MKAYLNSCLQVTSLQTVQFGTLRVLQDSANSKFKVFCVSQLSLLRT